MATSNSDAMSVGRMTTPVLSFASASITSPDNRICFLGGSCQVGKKTVNPAGWVMHRGAYLDVQPETFVSWVVQQLTNAFSAQVIAIRLASALTDKLCLRKNNSSSVTS